MPLGHMVLVLMADICRVVDSLREYEEGWEVAEGSGCDEKGGVGDETIECRV